MAKRATILAAGAALVAVGVAAALYGWDGPVGNADAACAAASAKAAALDPLAEGEVAAFQVAERPDKLSGVAYTDAAGAPATPGSRAKLTLVNFWATWCGPCRVEMPALSRLQAEMGGDRFEVVAINVDRQAEKAKAFLDEIGVANLPPHTDPTMASFTEMQKRGIARGLPVTLLLDAEGCRLGHMNGPAEWDSADAKRLIEAAL